MTAPELFQVVAGFPSDEELAALAVVLTTAMAAREREARGLPSGRGACGWASRSRLLRTPLTPGPGAWRRSTWPC
jgi:acyl-CoA carboxylase epsilon subunit